MIRRVLLLTFSLLAFAFLVPAAEARPLPVDLPQGPCYGLGWGPGACIRSGECTGVAATTGATDFYPGAGVCRTTPSGASCTRAYAGFASLGGFYGPNVQACTGPGVALSLCAGVLGNDGTVCL